MALITLKPNSQRETFSKCGKALDNYFMVFQPKDSNLYLQSPPSDVLQNLEQYALQYSLKAKTARENRGTSAFRGISREKGPSYRPKHEGANRTYNPKYNFIKTNSVAYSIPKSRLARDIEYENKENESIVNNRPFTAKPNLEKNKEIEENFDNDNIEEEKKIIQIKQRPHTAGTLFNKSNVSSIWEKKVFGCVNFGQQTLRKPFNFVSECKNEHNLNNFELLKPPTKSNISFGKSISRKNFLFHESRFDLPDKFYLINFDYSKIYSEKNKCFVNFNKNLSKKKIIPLKKEIYLNSSVDTKDLSLNLQNLAHVKREKSPNFSKLMGRNQVKILKPRAVSGVGFRPRSAYGLYSNIGKKPMGEIKFFNPK